MPDLSQSSAEIDGVKKKNIADTYFDCILLEESSGDGEHHFSRRQHRHRQPSRGRRLRRHSTLFDFGNPPRGDVMSEFREM